MSLPLTGTAALVLGPLFGFCFGWLLHRARVTDTNVIVNQFRLRDFTVAKVILTGISDGVWFAVLAIFVATFFAAIEWRETQHHQ